MRKQPSDETEEEEDFGDFDAPTQAFEKSENKEEEDFGDFDAPTSVKNEAASVFDTIEGSSNVLETTDPSVKETNEVPESDPWGDLFGSPAEPTTTDQTKSSNNDDFSFDDILGVDSSSSASDNNASEEERRVQHFLKTIPSNYDYMLKPIEITDISLLMKHE